MAKLEALALAGIAAASCGWARAADLPPAPSLPPLSTAGAPFGGWYLRGDVGVGVNSTTPDLQATEPIAAAVANGFSSSAATQTFKDVTLSPSGMIDLGAGYQFNDWFRADATLEYRAGGRLESGYALTSPASPAFGAPGQYTDDYRADLASIVGLVNGYASPGSWYGLSPFLGAGVGFADNRLSGSTDQGYPFARFRGRPFRQRIEDELRLGADGRHRLRYQSEPEARARIPLSQLRFDRDGRLELPHGREHDRRLQRWRERDLVPQQTGLERLPAGPHLSDRRAYVAARRAVAKEPRRRLPRPGRRSCADCLRRRVGLFVLRFSFRGPRSIGRGRIVECARGCRTFS